MNNLRDENIQLFIDESLEYLSDIENDFLTIEQQGANIDEQVINQVYRVAHSIKGGAGFLGLVNIKNLTHEMENVIARIRNRELIPDSQVVNALLMAADTLRNLINNFENSNDADITGQMDRLKAVLDGTVSADASVSVQTEMAGQALRNISIPGKNRQFTVSDVDFQDAFASNRHLYLMEFRFSGHNHSTGNGVAEAVEDLKRCGRVICHWPDGLLTDSSPTDTGGADLEMIVLYNSGLSSSDIRQLFHSSLIRLFSVTKEGGVEGVFDESMDIPEREPSDSISSGYSGQTSQVADTAILSETSPQPPPPTKAEEMAPTSTNPDATPSEASGPLPAFSQPPENTASVCELESFQTSLRVNVRLLDFLMNLAGELVLSRNQLIKAISHNDRRALEIAGQRVDSITTELQGAIMKARMQPLDIVFKKMPRVVRDLARKLGKEIDLIVEGKDVELDKSIIEQLNDPLVHIIRNALDHGIEPPDQRIEKGKKPNGTIRINAYHKSGQVHLDISDDGRGVDRDKIIQTAVANGLISREDVQHLSEEDQLRLLFIPGFSTSETVSDISGRGVGMDVVKSKLEELRGEVDIRSESGKGTTVHIKLPMTLAIISCLLVSHGERYYAIPQVHVVELVRIARPLIHKRTRLLGQAWMLQLRDKVLPLVSLEDVLQFGHPLTDESIDNPNQLQQYLSEKYVNGLNIVVVSTGVYTFGLVVERLHDSEEIVIKPLGRHLKQCSGYAGATILGDGRVALVIDIMDIARMAGLSSKTIPEDSVSVKEKQEYVLKTDSAMDRYPILLFRGPGNEPVAVPMELVERIEKISSSYIETINGKKVIHYQNTTTPLLTLDTIFRSSSSTTDPKVLIVFFHISGRNMALQVYPPIDSITCHWDVDEITLSQPGIAGSIVVNGKTTLVLDILSLLATQHPNWVQDTPVRSGGSSGHKAVLLAEDSSFFRNQISHEIQKAGYPVMVAEDGYQAWQLLQQHMATISLVVTDIEMPNMDGFALTQRIRDHAQLDHLPVIAVTSLDSKKDQQRAFACGINHYFIKLNRDQLIDKIRYYMDNQPEGSST